MAVERWSRSGQRIDVITTLPRTNHALLIQPRGERGASMTTRQPFSDAPLMAIAPDGTGIVVVERASGTEGGVVCVVRYELSGKIAWERRYSTTAGALPAAEVQDSTRRIAAKVVEAARNRVPPATAESWVRKALYVPRFRPAITSALVGRDGSVWLRLWPRGKTVTWVSVDRNGSPEGRVESNVDLVFRQIDGRQAWATTTDENDVPVVVRYRIRK
jgi:hypothetical protein